MAPPFNTSALDTQQWPTLVASRSQKLNVRLVPNRRPTPVDSALPPLKRKIGHWVEGQSPTVQDQGSFSSSSYQNPCLPCSFRCSLTTVSSNNHTFAQPTTNSSSVPRPRHHQFFRNPKTSSPCKICRLFIHPCSCWWQAWRTPAVWMSPNWFLNVGLLAGPR